MELHGVIRVIGPIFTQGINALRADGITKRRLERPQAHLRRDRGLDRGAAMKIEVTQRHIDEGVRMEIDNCPLAKAVTESFGTLCTVGGGFFLVGEARCGKKNTVFS